MDDYINALHDLARIEDFLRDYAAEFPADSDGGAAVHELLLSEFGVVLVTEAVT